MFSVFVMSFVGRGVATTDSSSGKSCQPLVRFMVFKLILKGRRPEGTFRQRSRRRKKKKKNAVR
jgi:hypothetical protein